MKKIIVNFSGHTLCTEAQDSFNKYYDNVINPEPINFDFGKDVEEQLKNVISMVLDILDADTALTIIPPGQSTLSILVISYIHGIIGHFPKICYLELGKNGLYLPKTEYEIDVQNIRMAGRMFRMNSFAS